MSVRRKVRIQLSGSKRLVPCERLDVLQRNAVLHKPGRRRALARLEQNPRHPGLASHTYESFPVDGDIKVWDSYVENNTPFVWRIFWRYGPNEPDSDPAVITVLAITPHP